MAKNVKKVIEMLKPKTKALGFSPKELKSVAQNIADNLTLEDDASEEDVEAEISAQIDAALPYLKLAQAAASRIVSASRATAHDDNDEDDDDDTPEKRGKEDKPKREKGKPNREDSEVMELLKSLKDEVASLKQERKTTDYKSRVSALLGKKGEKVLQRELKNLSRMTFKDDDEFEEYLSDLEDDFKDLPDIVKAHEDPGASGGGRTTPEELSDSEIADIAGLIS